MSYMKFGVKDVDVLARLRSQAGCGSISGWLRLNRQFVDMCMRCPTGVRKKHGKTMVHSESVARIGTFA